MTDTEKAEIEFYKNGSAESVLKRFVFSEQEEKLIRETNVGVMVCNVPEMYDYLDMLDCNNSQGEYYLTELPALMKKNGKKVVIHSILDTDEAMGANTPEDLDNIIKVLEKRRTEIND